MREESQVNGFEIDLLAVLKQVIRRKFLALGIVVGFTVAVIIYSLTLPDVFICRMILMPSTDSDTPVMSSMSNAFGGLAQIAGIKLPGTKSSNEIEVVLKSNYLKEKVINNYSLLPVLFKTRWDEEKGEWKKSERSLLASLAGALKSLAMPAKEGDGGGGGGGPTVDDGIRAFNDVMRVITDALLGTIMVEIEDTDPNTAYKLALYISQALREGMRGDYIENAKATKKSLESALLKIDDPIIRNKLYELIASQVESIATANVKKDFGFKIVDPPRVPDKKAKPVRSRIVMVGFAASIFLAVLVIMALDSFLAFQRKAKTAE